MADGSVTIEVNGDASELIAAFRQAAAAADALSGNISGIADAFQSVTAAANQINGGGMDEAANSAQNLSDRMSEMDEYIDELDAAFDEMRNDPFNTQADGADELREDLDRLGDAADDAEEDLDDLSDSADDLDEKLDQAGGGAKKLNEVFKGTFLGNLASKGVEMLTDSIKNLGEKVIDFGKQAVEAYASYEQNVGGIETLFGDASDTMKQYAAEAYTTAGLSANKYMETATSFAASLVSGLGGDVKQAAEIANQAIIDMSDNANKMGTDMESIQNAYQGFAKQNYTMLDNLKLGYGGTQSEMIRLINDSGVLEKKISSLDGISFATMIQAIHEVQRKLEIVGTTHDEAATTIEGSVNSMKGAWENFLVGLAAPDADLSGLTQKLIQSIGVVIQNVAPAIGRVLSSIGSLITDGLSNLFPNVGEWVSGPIESLKSAFSGVAEAFNKVFTPERREAISNFFQAFTEVAATVAITALSGALEFLANIINAVITAIGALITFFSSTLPASIQAVITWFQNLPQNITNALTTAGNAIRNWASSAKDALVTGVSNAINAVVNWFNGLSAKISGGLAAGAAAIKSWGSSVKEAMVNAVTNAINAVVTWFNNLSAKISGALSSAGAAIRNWASTTVSNMKTAATNAVNAVVTFFTSLPGKITSALSGALSALVSWGSQMAAKARAKMVEVGNNIKSTLSGLPGQLVSIGANIVQGLINGISSKIGAAIAKIKEIGNSIKGAFTSLLGIHSPSRVFYEYGENVIQGLANALNDNVDLAKRATENIANAVTKEIQGLNKKVEKIESDANERAAAKELAEYKKNLKEKNEELAKAAKKDRAKIQEEIAKLNEDWNEKQLQKQETAEKEALKSQITTLEKMKSEYDKRVSEIEQEIQKLEDARDSFGEKVADVDLFTEEDDVFQLTDLQKSIDAINKYGDSIEALRDRGISDSLMDEILGMDKEKAQQYMSALLKMGDEQWEKYLDLWQEKEDAAQRVAANVYSNIDLISDSMWQDLRNEFGDAGIESMENFAGGLEDGGKEAVEQTKEIVADIQAELDKIGAEDVVIRVVYDETAKNSWELTESSKNKKDKTLIDRGTDYADLVNAIKVANASEYNNREIVLNLNGKEVARGLIDDIRAVEDQSPRIVSD